MIKIHFKKVIANLFLKKRYHIKVTHHPFAKIICHAIYRNAHCTAKKYSVPLCFLPRAIATAICFIMLYVTLFNAVHLISRNILQWQIHLVAVWKLHKTSLFPSLVDSLTLCLFAYFSYSSIHTYTRWDCFDAACSMLKFIVQRVSWLRNSKTRYELNTYAIN